LRLKSSTSYDAGHPPASRCDRRPMTTPHAPAPPAALEALAAARSRIAVGLTAAMTAVYVAFILLIAFGKSWLGTTLAPGLSVGIALGVVVIVVAWALILVYVRWANTHYDHRVASIRDGARR
jgi:uncharacterized membrane protein (DUF485 family)